MRCWAGDCTPWARILTMVCLDVDNEGRFILLILFKIVLRRFVRDTKDEGSNILP